MGLYGLAGKQSGLHTRLFKAYSKYREDIRRDMKIDDSSRIDRHKVAAALTLAILQERPLEIDTQTQNNLSWQARYINEELSIISSIRLVLLFVDYEHQKLQGSSPCVGFLDKPFSWPDTGNTQETYARQLAKELDHAIRQDKHDIYLLANVYFLLEAFHLSKLGLPPVSLATSNVYLLREPPIPDLG